MPKRKAATKFSSLVESDMEEEGLLGEDAANEGGDTASPPAKRQKGRPKGAATKAAASKPATRKARSTVVVGPKKRAPAKRTARGAQKVADANAEADDAVENGALRDYSDDNNEGDGQNGVVPDISSGDELSSPKVAYAQKTESTTGDHLKGPARRVTLDGEFEYTPTGSRRTVRNAQTEPSAEPEPRIEETLAEVEETIFHEEAPAVPSSPSKPGRGGKKQSTVAQSANQRRRGVNVSDADKGESDASLRRKLGDMTKKYETMESRYRNLREIGIVEANANVDKLRKQCEATTAASNNLIASLKKELAAHSAAAKQSRAVQKQLQDRETQVIKLEKQIADMSSNLTSSQNEIKSLQAKLAAARNESAQARVPGSATKNGPNSRGGTAGGAEAVQAAHIAQLKEDLYSDLTGLIIRDVKKRDNEDVYDCIQTGIHGSLHFKLAVAQDTDSRTTTSFESAELHYMPLLDANRDRDLIALLPEYLSVDITFSRQHAAKFYSRVVDTLTKRHVDG